MCFKKMSMFPPQNGSESLAISNTIVVEPTMQRFEGEL